MSLKWWVFWRVCIQRKIKPQVGYRDLEQAFTPRLLITSHANYFSYVVRANETLKVGRGVSIISLFFEDVPEIIRRFLMTFGNFPKISENYRRSYTTFRKFSKVSRRRSEGYLETSGHFLKFSEDCRRILKIPKRCFEQAIIHFSPVSVHLRN